MPEQSELIFQVLGPNDLNEVYDFANDRLSRSIPDETERMFKSWTVKWRREALEHYLKLGWSFIVRRESKICGFFLGQAFIFFRGQTQTLWVEHIEAEDESVAFHLVDVAVRVAREKHLQRAMFSDAENWTSALERWRPNYLLSDTGADTGSDAERIAIVKTTKGE